MPCVRRAGAKSRLEVALAGPCEYGRATGGLRGHSSAVLHELPFVQLHGRRVEWELVAHPVLPAPRGTGPAALCADDRGLHRAPGSEDGLPASHGRGCRGLSKARGLLRRLVGPPQLPAGGLVAEAASCGSHGRGRWRRQGWWPSCRSCFPSVPGGSAEAGRGSIVAWVVGLLVGALACELLHAHLVLGGEALITQILVLLEGLARGPHCDARGLPEKRVAVAQG
mmetsp:Transcript_31710/g.91693  ORF Transcript_31710/g.91693 Transcript_31710/m.91693 type:complete len:225 (+) Transcript_31710:594-1268(+)